MEAPIPGTGPWEQIASNPKAWHFGFGGPDMERLVAGPEHIVLDHFWNDFSANPADISEAMRHFMPCRVRCGRAQRSSTPSRRMRTIAGPTWNIWRKYPLRSRALAA